MTDEKVRLALTVGDPAGVGPEIVAALIAQRKLNAADLYIIGAYAPLADWLTLPACKTAHVIPYTDAERLSEPESFPIFIDTGGDMRFARGRASAESGRASGRAVETAVFLAKRAIVEGIVTGPISKEALQKGGYGYRGHTDMLASLFGAHEAQMMMVNGRLRIVILTRDMPLREVPAAVTAERLRSGIMVAAEALGELWGIERPRIAVAALNPHSGDGGVLGDEELVTIVPVLKDLRRDGIAVDGPFSADTLFYKWEDKGYDVYVALYHDQGMIPFKIGGFERGVNVTIGLPIVRTSVCHGTAYDLAGSGSAGTGSFESAVSLAIECCLARRRRGGPRPA
jgi:4-hydroxythreonine-4-phosphate dehydrogenase